MVQCEFHFKNISLAVNSLSCYSQGQDFGLYETEFPYNIVTIFLIYVKS